ncbi:MAG: hypothetical protein QM734_11030 [Cyclobacteriaceae bacterium]
MCERTDSSFQILAECADGYIGLCSCCHEFNYVYKNLLLTFKEEDMQQFFDWFIAARNQQGFDMALANGRDHFFRGPIPNLFFAYSAEELDEIEKLYIETNLLLEARKLVNI